MKSIARLLAHSACCLFAATVLNGQGITVLSTLELTPASAVPVAADSWVAFIFRTGDDAWAYRLETVTVLLQPEIGEVSSLSAVVSTRLSRLGQGRWLGPPVMGEGGRVSFDGQDVLLKSGTIYWLGLTAAQPLEQGAYQWSVGVGVGGVAMPGWVTRTAARSADGQEWQTILDRLQYAISVTPIPEPSPLVLLSLGGLFLLATRRPGGRRL